MPSQSSYSSRHRDHLILIAPPRSSSSSSRRCAHLHCCAVCSSHHCAIERSICCAFGRFASQFIVAPVMSCALFIITPSRSRAQVHYRAVEVASSFSAGRRIPSPCHHLFRGPANLIAMPQSFQRASKPNHFRGPAHSIAKPPNLILPGISSSCLLYHNST